jgi:alkylation response protein AidB-like acyl-CoA dehydrogenase
VTAFSAAKSGRLLDPLGRLIGAERERFTIMLCEQGHTRITIAAQGPGIPPGARDDALDHVREREQFGRAGRAFVFVALRRVQLRNRVPAAAYSASRGTGVKAGSPVAVCIASRVVTAFAGPASSSI